jgi:restriction system protein
MAVPDYQSIMLPLLRLAGDGQEHKFSEAMESLAKEFGLSEQERDELLPSGAQTKFGNRAGWARTYMTKAGLLVSPGRGRFKITERGLGVLKTNPERISAKSLRQYPEFVEFQGTHRQEREPQEQEQEAESEQTPAEALEASYVNLRKALAQDLLDKVKSCSPVFFEHLVVDLLVAMGYGGSRKDAGQAVGRTGDGGIDGIIKEDKLGLDAVCVQAKRWDGTVGRPVVQAFAGSLEGVRAKKGVLITTSQFSGEAEDYVGSIEKKIVLINGEQLAQLMIDHNIGVTELATYALKRIDNDYFGEE